MITCFNQQFITNGQIAVYRKRVLHILVMSFSFKYIFSVGVK